MPLHGHRNGSRLTAPEPAPRPPHPVTPEPEPPHAIPQPWKSLRLAAALAAVSAAAVPLAPSASAGSAAAEPAGHLSRTVKPAASIVYDPGMKWRCYSVSDETAGSNYGNDSRDCGKIVHPNRVNADCTWFGYTSPRGVECPAWRFVTYNWGQDSLRAYPGYDHQVQGDSGAPLKLVLQNNSPGPRDTAGQTQNCELKEVAVSHEYVGSSFKRKADGSTYNFADGQVKVAYDALVEQTGGFACEEKRALLTTDFSTRDQRHLRRPLRPGPLLPAERRRRAVVQQLPQGRGDGRRLPDDGARRATHLR